MPCCDLSLSSPLSNLPSVLFSLPINYAQRAQSFGVADAAIVDHRVQFVQRVDFDFNVFVFVGVVALFAEVLGQKAVNQFGRVAWR